MLIYIYSLYYRLTTHKEDNSVVICRVIFHKEGEMVVNARLTYQKEDMNPWESMKPPLQGRLHVQILGQDVKVDT